MKRILLMKGFLTLVLMLTSCGGSGGENTSSDPYINPYAKVVNGEIVQQNTATAGIAPAGYTVNGTEIAYITAFALDNGKLVYSTAPVNADGTFEIHLKGKLKYSFVLFDINMRPVLMVREGMSNVIIILDNSYVKIVINTTPDGQLVVVGVEHDENSILDRDEAYEDLDDDNIPDFAESDNDGDGLPDYDEDGDGTFDGVEDNDGDGVVDGAEDSDNDYLPDPIDDDNDNGVSEDEESDDENYDNDSGETPNEETSDAGDKYSEVDNDGDGNDISVDDSEEYDENDVEEETEENENNDNEESSEDGDYDSENIDKQ